MTGSDEVSPPEQVLAEQLELLPGDIILSEMPFTDASPDDFTHFNNFEPAHTCVWVNGDGSKVVARSLHEGYQPPGLMLTGLWPGRHAVFRYIGNQGVAKQFGEIMRNWAASDSAEIIAKNKPFLSAANDLFALYKNKHLAILSEDGIQRAIGFSARRAMRGEPEMSAAQRCTAIVAAAFQASILADIVKQHDNSLSLILEKKTFLEQVQDMFIIEWQKSQVGKIFIEATNKNDFSELFPEPFAIDQRYATPKYLYEKMKEHLDFCLVGHYSFYNNGIISVEKPKMSSDRPIQKSSQAR